MRTVHKLEFPPTPSPKTDKSNPFEAAFKAALAKKVKGHEAVASETESEDELFPKKAQVVGGSETESEIDEKPLKQETDKALVVNDLDMEIGEFVNALDEVKGETIIDLLDKEIGEVVDALDLGDVNHAKSKVKKQKAVKVPVKKDKQAKVPAVKQEQAKVPAMKQEQAKTPAVKHEHAKVPAMKQEQAKTPAVKHEHAKVPTVKHEHAKAPVVFTEHVQPKVRGMKRKADKEEVVETKVANLKPDGCTSWRGSTIVYFCSIPCLKKQKIRRRLDNVVTYVAPLCKRCRMLNGFTFM